MGHAFQPAVGIASSIQPVPIVESPTQQTNPPPNVGLFYPPFSSDAFFIATRNYPEYPNDRLDTNITGPDTPTSLYFHIKIDRFFTSRSVGHRR